MKANPDWSSLPNDVGPRLRDAISVCLEKDVKKRRRDAGDVLLDIESASVREHDSQIPSRRRYVWQVASFATLLILVITLALLYQRSATGGSEGSSFEFEIFSPGNKPLNGLALSWDGKRLVFVADRSLWVRDLNSLEPRRLEGTDGAGDPFWSPDSKSVGFFADGKLKRMEVDVPGSIRILADAVSNRGGSWNDRGDIIFVPRSGGAVWCAVPIMLKTSSPECRPNWEHN